MDKETKIKLEISSIKSKLKKCKTKKESKILNDKLDSLRKELKSFKVEETNTPKEVELEILVEELRKTVLTLGSLIRVTNANLKDENLEQFLDLKLKELKSMQSLGTLKDYLKL